MIESIDELFEKVEKNLTFKETLDFEKNYNFHFKEVENDRFWFVDNPYFSDMVGNFDFIFFLPDAKINMQTAEGWSRFYTNIITEKSEVRIRWRLPNFHELTQIINAFILLEFYTNANNSALKYWNGREYWTNEICGYTKTIDNECVRKMKCGRIIFRLNLDAGLNLKIDVVENHENYLCYGLLIGEIVEND